MPTESGPQHVEFTTALQRLTQVVTIGCFLIIVYALRHVWKSPAASLGDFCVALMTGGAALLTGGLLGFLFGVPHTRLVEASREADIGTREKSKDESNKPKFRGTSRDYLPNTSLEQISDWLTKILVGVGLVEIKEIPGKLRDLAVQIGKNLSDGPQAEAFVLTVLIYFSVSGFVFGFLWARLYLPRWFAQADQVKKLEEKVSQLEERQQADAMALTLVIQLINSQEDDTLVTEPEIFSAIKAASTSMRAQIFHQVEQASQQVQTTYDDAKIEGIISILKALIASDSKERYHRNHAELSYAFRRMKPPDWDRAQDEITKAIAIREKLQLSGWKYYEFHLARCMIENNLNFKSGLASDGSFIERVLAVLREAYTDTQRWNKWAYPSSTVVKWMTTNHIDETRLQQTKP